MAIHAKSRCATIPSGLSTATSTASTAIARRRLYDLVMREVELPLFRAVSTTRKATRAAPRPSSASIGAPCARNCANSGWLPDEMAMAGPPGARCSPFPTRPAWSSSRASSPGSASSCSRPAARHARSPGAGLPVTEVAAITGFPEIMDGRVKTLHPKVHGGLLGRRGRRRRRDARAGYRADRPAGRQSLSVRRDRSPDPAARYEDAIENIDVGGPRCCAPRRRTTRDVTVVVDPADYAGAARTSCARGGVTRPDVPRAARREGLRATPPATTRWSPTG